MVLITKQNYSQGTDSHAETIEFDAIGQHVKNGRCGACRQKAATVLPNRTAAALCICSCLPFFGFDILRYGVTS